MKKLNKLIDKNTVFLSLITAGLIGISLGGLSYMMSKGAEQKLYMSINSYIGQKGEYMQGMNLAFERKNITCYGLIKFDCVIKDAILNAPKQQLNIFKAEEIKIGTFTKNGFDIRQRHLNFYADFKNITYMPDSPLMKDLTKEGKDIADQIFPLSGRASLKIDRFKNGEAVGKINLSIESKIANLLSKINIEVIDNKKIVYFDDSLHLTDQMNATAGAKMNKKYNTIIRDFELYTENTGIKNFLYKLYTYYYSHSSSEEDRLRINNEFIGVTNSNLIIKKDFLNEFEERLKSMVPDSDQEELKEHISGLIFLIDKIGNKTKVKGTNKDNFTAEELNLLRQLDELKKPWIYFNLKTTQEKR